MPSHPPLDSSLPTSLTSPGLPFCLPCFGAYVRHGLPRSSLLEGGCGCCVASTRLTRQAQCVPGPQAKTMKKEEECHFCDSKSHTWTRVAIAASKKSLPGRMWVVACDLCQAAFHRGYPPRLLYTWDESNPRAKDKETKEHGSICTSCWLAKGKCHCKYPSIYKRRPPFVKRTSNSARDEPRPDPPVTAPTLNVIPIHDAAYGSLQNDPALYEQAVTNFALNYAAEDNETWL